MLSRLMLSPNSFLITKSHSTLLLSNDIMWQTAFCGSVSIKKTHVRSAYQVISEIKYPPTVSVRYSKIDVSSVKSYHESPSGSLSGIAPLKTSPDSSLISFGPFLFVHPSARTDVKTRAANRAAPVLFIFFIYFFRRS